MLTKTCFLSIFLTLWFSSGLVFATVYYVDADRPDDSGSGTSVSTAWKTVAKVLSVGSAGGFSPDDFVKFDNCDTWNESLDDFNNISGTVGHPITFTSYGKCAPRQPILYRFSQYGSEQYFDIKDIHFRKSPSSTHIVVMDGARNVNFVNNTVDANGLSGSTYHNAIDIAGSSRSISNINIQGNTILGGGLVGGINFSGSTYGGTGLTVSGNIIKNCAEFGVQMYCALTGNLPIHDSTVSKNTISDTTTRNGAGHGINSGFLTYNLVVDKNKISNSSILGVVIDTGSHDVLVKNNILINNHEQLGAMGGAGGTIYNIKFYNNTLYSSSSSNPYGFYFNSTDGGSNIYIKNNLVVSASINNQEIKDESATLFTNMDTNYNLWYETLDTNGPRFYIEGHSFYFSEKDDLAKNPHQREINSVSANPLLNSNYTLQPGSLAIGLGVPLAEVTDDINGTPRKTKPCVGAYEYSGVTLGSN